MRFKPTGISATDYGTGIVLNVGVPHVYAKDIDAIVRVDFEDGQHYGGLLIPKGQIQKNLQDVYFIQLYETDAEGEVIYNVDGSMKSTLQMWMEEWLPY